MWITGFCVGEGVNRTSIPVAFSQMDAFMMLMCCYQSTNVAYNPQPPHTYDKLVKFICSKFKELTLGKLLFFYKIPGYNEFTLQNVVDMENMLCLARSFRLQIVDMVVKQNVGVNTWIQSNDQSVNETYSHSRLSVLDNLDMDDEVDLLQTFCPHNDKVFISKSWACRHASMGSPTAVPLIFLDATFLKGRFKGFLLAATTKNGNQGLFPLAFVVVDSENTSNWSWFLQNLAHVLNGDRPLTFTSDRTAGLLKAMPTIFPNTEHAFCLQHLKKNLRDRGRRYGKMWSNAAKSFNSWIREACNLPITRMVDSIRAKIMRQMSKHRVASQTWTGTICPKMESCLEKAFNKGRSWRVNQSNADVYEIHLLLSVTVTIGTQTCSCFQWQRNRFPCVHAMVAVQKSGRDLNDLVEPYFHVSEYHSTYAASIFQNPTMEQPPFDPHDYLINPPPPPVSNALLAGQRKSGYYQGVSMCNRSAAKGVAA
ncbi:hypothetical protein ACSBR2_002388 [Camellia fascicularis]